MLVLVPIVAGTASQVTTLPAEGYMMRVWQTDDGLPQNMVNSAVQTRDGYLWLGTYSGLARFDGERFKVFDSINTPGLTDRRVTALFEDRAGVLWIGHESGSVTRYRDGHFELFRRSSGNASERVIGIGTDEQGRLWAMHHNGTIDSLDDPHQLASLIAPTLPEVMAWSRSTEGSIWLAENGQGARLEHGELRTLTLPPPRLANYVLRMAATDDGGAWIFCDHRIRKWKGGRWAEDRGEYPWPEGPLASALELRDGTLAVGTIYAGVYLIYGDGRPPVHIDRSNGLPQNWVRFLHEDREGNLWAGTGSAGLVSIHKTAFSVLNSPDQWNGCTVLSVAPGRNGALWVGTDGAALYHFADGQWRHFGEADGLANRYIPAVTETAEGDVWVGNFWWGGPYRLGNGRFARPPSLDETSSPVFALLPATTKGEILVGNRDGLMRLSATQAERLVKAPDGSVGAVCAIVQDRNGVIWAGFNEGGLVRYEDGKISRFRQTDGLASDAVQCLLLADDGALWIGTADNGLTRLKDGRFTNLGLQHGLSDKVICCILDDGLGYFWLSTHHGIQRIAKDELNRCADGSIPTFFSQIYGKSDGLPMVEFTGGLQAAGCKTADGRLWFASGEGLISVNASSIAPNRLPPPVALESMLVDGKAVEFARGLVASRLPPDHQQLEFRFSGLSFVAPNKVLFKYRLEGLDNTWVEVGARRAAFYGHLPPGAYQFKVIACNNDGVWNTEGASLTFSVAPFFWQTWWFFGSSAIVVVTAVAMVARYLTRRRMQRRIERLEREQAIERERTRIAQDIHDDLGSSLTRIAMLSQPTQTALAEPQRTAVVLSRINSTAAEVTRALDEIVWAIDPRYDTLDSLVSYMGKFAQDLLGAANIRCRLDLPVQLPPWPLTAETRHNLFLAFKEALNNTLKHASATEAHVTLNLRDDGFVLSLKDNGRGFDPNPGASTGPDRAVSGHGLPNLQRRLAEIGGHCEIRSAPGLGTTISFIICVAPANNRRPSRVHASNHAS
jgi:signal transduction histidine kinase/ligand-binding sensor domain-containing protein